MFSPSYFVCSVPTQLTNTILGVHSGFTKILKSEIFIFFQKLISSFQLDNYYGPYLSPECWDEKEKSIFGLLRQRRYFQEKKSSKIYSLEKVMPLYSGDLFCWHKCSIRVLNLVGLLNYRCILGVMSKLRHALFGDSRGR